MPMIKQRTVMTANGTAFPLAGSQFEYLPFPAIVEFAILGDTGSNVRATAFSGSDLLMQSSQIDILAVASPIIYPDHYALNDTAGRGERVGVELMEMAAGVPIVRTQVKLSQL